MHATGTAAALSADQIASLHRAARDFAAMALSQMLAPMFDTVDSADGVFGGGAAEHAFRPMLTDAIAKQIAAQGGLGLERPIFDCLLRAQEAALGGTAP